VRVAAALVAVWLSSAGGAPLLALKLDITHADIERALIIARSSDSERARFHARYIQRIDTPSVDRVEVISEFRRVVLMAEEHAARGDRFFAYSTTRAHDALQVFRRRVSIRAHIRFHPLNNYVTLPPVTIGLVGNEAALIGVRRDPVHGSTAKPTEAAPLLGGTIEASFSADGLGQARREFVVMLEGRELGRVVVDFAEVE
jgi:hypothetical protein